MSNFVRIIPKLDIKGEDLVKGVNLEGLRVLGEPHEFAKYYFEQGADELFYQDVVASLYGRNSLKDIISKTAENIFIPLTVGGGVRSLSDITDILRAGADKVSINSTALQNPNFIKEAAEKFGSSTIVISIEAIKQPKGNYLAFTDNGRNCSGRDVFDWARQVEELGAGEIIITSVDREGKGDGMNLELIDKIVKKTNIPVIAHGGIGKMNHCIETLNKIKLNGIAISSMFHYEYLANKKDLKNIIRHKGNIDYLKKKLTPKNIAYCSIKSLKKELLKQNIFCRHD